MWAKVDTGKSRYGQKSIWAKVDTSISITILSSKQVQLTCIMSADATSVFVSLLCGTGLIAESTADVQVCTRQYVSQFASMMRTTHNNRYASMRLMLECILIHEPDVVVTNGTVQLWSVETGQTRVNFAVSMQGRGRAALQTFTEQCTQMGLLQRVVTPFAKATRAQFTATGALSHALADPCWRVRMMNCMRAVMTATMLVVPSCAYETMQTAVTAATAVRLRLADNQTAEVAALAEFVSGIKTTLARQKTTCSW
jgi:hypothetical protein